jgi:uncharacterized protein (DUF697 family)
MADDDKDKRLERALEEGRDWLERSAEDVVKRLGHAWRHARAFGDDDGDREPAESKPPADLFEESELDGEELFSRERQRELEELGQANILIIGQTGAGKSTLVNAVFRKPLAKAGAGKPVTKVNQRFEDPSVPVTLYDTKGVELGDSKRRIIRDFKRLIEKSRKADPKDHIHLLWYCIHPELTRIQDYDIDIIRALAEDVPVILVFTHTIDDVAADELEASIVELDLPIESGRAIRTLAEARRIGKQTLKPRGLDELVRLTTELLPAAVRRAFISAQSIAIDLKADQGRGVVAAATGAAAVAAAVPVPAADAVMLMPIQLGMLAGVTAVFGVDLSDEQAKKLIGAVTGGQQGLQKVGQQLVKQLAKYVPGGNVLNATVAAALTGAMGEAYVRLCIEILRREAAGKPMPDADMLKFFTAAYQGILRRSKPASGQAEAAQPAATATPQTGATKAPPRARAARAGTKPRGSESAAKSAGGTSAKRTSSSRASSTKTSAKPSSRPRKPSTDS